MRICFISAGTFSHIGPYLEYFRQAAPPGFPSVVSRLVRRGRDFGPEKPVVPAN